MGEWKTIDSAPKDGTRMDLYGFWRDRRELRAFGGLGREIIRRDPGRRLIDYYWCLTHKCWRSYKNQHFVDRPPDDIDVSHWMPLPPPPREMRADQG